MPGLLDASAAAVAAASHEVVIGHGPYLFWNEVPSQGDAYSVAKGDKLTFRYNRDNTVYLMATESGELLCSQCPSGSVASLAPLELLPPSSPTRPPARPWWPVRSWRAQHLVAVTPPQSD